MVGILDESDIYKCRAVIPKEQTFLTGFSLLLLSNSNTISHATSKIRTYSSRPVGLLLSNQQAFLVAIDGAGGATQLVGSCDLANIKQIQTGYLHSSSSASKDDHDGVLISDRRTSPGQYSFKITRNALPSWTLMTFSPSDTPEIQKERVQRIVSTINSLVREAQIQEKLKSKLSLEEKLFVPLVYYQLNDKILVEGELYINLQKLSFIQKYVRDFHLKIQSKIHENYSFSIDTISVFECKQVEAKVIKKFSQVNIISQGRQPTELITFYFPSHDLPQITNSIIRLITESQDIADQIYQENSNSNNSTNNNNGTKSLTDSDFYLVDDEDQQEEQVQEEEDRELTQHSVITTLENNTPTHKPTKNNFKTKSDILSPDDILWIQSYLPLRHNDDTFELIYSTNKHGISIKTFFSKLRNRSPCILAIKDNKGCVFGAYTSDPWDTEKKVHYGSGETFLYKITPQRKKFSWTRVNDDFMLSTKEAFISLGSGGKGVGLWVDEDLLYGSSNRCDTFGNEVLANNSDFKVMELEVWSPLKVQPAGVKQMNATDFFGTTFTYKPPARTLNSFGY